MGVSDYRRGVHDGTLDALDNISRYAQQCADDTRREQDSKYAMRYRQAMTNVIRRCASYPIPPKPEEEN